MSEQPASEPTTTTQPSSEPTGDTGQTPSQPSSEFTIPEAYKDRGWTEKVKSQDDVWKLLDNSQSLIGKRPAGIPAADASDEEWNKFFDSARPESPDKYELSDDFGDDIELPEGTDFTEYKPKVQEIAHKAGLTPKQADMIWKEYVRAEYEAVQKMQGEHSEKAGELDKQFDDIVQKHFGDNYDQVSEQAQNWISENVPEDLRSAVTQMEDIPQAMALMISVAQKAQEQIDQVKKEYSGEDGLNSGGQAGSMSQEEVRAKLTEANATARKADPFSPERKQAEQDVQKYREMLSKMFK